MRRVDVSAVVGGPSGCWFLRSVRVIASHAWASILWAAGALLLASRADADARNRSAPLAGSEAETVNTRRRLASMCEEFIAGGRAKMVFFGMTRG
jgi:hypothetical protein